MNLNVNLNVTLATDSPIQIEIVNPPPEPPPNTNGPVATRLRIGDDMSTISIDTTTETVTLEFVDDKGDVTSPPAGATVTFGVDNSVVATVSPDPNNPFSATITPASVGTVNISATVSGANDPSGNPLPSPSPVTLQVNPGAAVGERLTVSDSSQAGATGPSGPSGTPAPPSGATGATGPSGTDGGATGPTGASGPSGTATTAEPTQPVYTFAGDQSTIDASAWPSSGFETTDPTPRPLYYYAGDTADSGQTGPASGNGLDNGQWTAYTGAVQPATA